MSRLPAALVLALGCASPRGERDHVLLWGDVHGHTSLSDGNGTVAEYFEHARDVARLDFAIVTDHDFGNGPPWRMPDEAWRETQATADRMTEAGRFVAIAGYEWTSAPKYWSENPGPSERHFAGAPRHFNHKNVYFPRAGAPLLHAKDAATMTPDLLAEAVARWGGLVHNNHPGRGEAGRDPWSYEPRHAAVIANTEILPDVVWYEGVRHELGTEALVQELLARGVRTGFVAGSDTHEGKPSARTAVISRARTREALFEALRARRCYATNGARIRLDFRIDGACMGSEIEVRAAPRVAIDVTGTAAIASIELVRDGVVVCSTRPEGERAEIEWADEEFRGPSYYYVRVTQSDSDAHGNPYRAWSSPIWVRRAQ